MRTQEKKSWSRWWATASPAWEKLTDGKQPDAIDELRWVAWLYELLSRDRRAYILGKPFVELPASHAWLWRDEMIDTVRPEKLWSACCDATEARLASDTVAEAATLAQWSEPVCFNLLRGDSEILAAVQLRLDSARAKMKATNPGRKRDKTQPWSEVEAVEEYLAPSPTKVLPKQAYQNARRRITAWKATFPGRVEKAVAASRLLFRHG